MTIKIKTSFFDTISAISVNSGVVKMHLASQDQSEESLENKDPAKIKMNTEEIIAMPLPGFIYAVTVINGLINNPKMKEQIEKYKELGLLPQANQNEKKSAKN